MAEENEQAWAQMVLIAKIVREKAGQYPDAFYKGVAGDDLCYFTRGTVENGPRCGCLIGQAIMAVDPGGWYDRLFDADNLGSTTASAMVLECTDGYGVDHPQFARLMEWLNSVQMRQDKRISWRECVEEADEAYKRASLARGVQENG